MWKKGLGAGCVGMYIDDVLAGLGLEDKLLKMAVTYVMNEHYHLKNTIISALFSRLGKYTADEKSMFLTINEQI